MFISKLANRACNDNPHIPHNRLLGVLTYQMFFAMGLNLSSPYLQGIRPANEAETHLRRYVGIDEDMSLAEHVKRLHNLLCDMANLDYAQFQSIISLHPYKIFHSDHSKHQRHDCQNLFGGIVRNIQFRPCCDSVCLQLKTDAYTIHAPIVNSEQVKPHHGVQSLLNVFGVQSPKDIEGRYLHLLSDGNNPSVTSCFKMYTFPFAHLFAEPVMFNQSS